MASRQTSTEAVCARREAMVDRQIWARGIRGAALLRAFREVPREAFVPEEFAAEAYADAPLPIGEGQTISQPYIVALMIEALELHSGARVLEIGTGSGYAAAILSHLAAEVYTVERHGSLATDAAALFEELGYGNVHVLHGDGTLGWPEHAPFDAILVSAGGPEVPPAPLLEQLAEGGRLVVPVGSTRTQELIRLRRCGGRFSREPLGAVRFVPLIGAEGWPEPP
ncbi:MAG: protein-L-isoaspartate(D-aspartate) O-methyltransferase [Fimbriimonadaceae bacterium]|nr:protein-L-isoaspartate(D-aspartate) O-methyltransferase [Fimbriimonadaceae bacterium]